MVYQIPCRRKWSMGPRSIPCWPPFGGFLPRPTPRVRMGSLLREGWAIPHPHALAFTPRLTPQRKSRRPPHLFYQNGR